MKVIGTVAEFDAARKLLEDKTVGFVPTMGALHEGHASLIRRAVSECGAVVVSDFVNPTQFNNKTDFETYPRRLEDDAAFIEPMGVFILFAPTVEEMYPEGTDYNKKVFDLGGLDRYGEGPRRPGHFNGMAQVVTRLFDIVRPDRAYFGEKDFQQLAIVEYFVKALGYNIEIVRCPSALPHSKGSGRTGAQFAQQASDSRTAGGGSAYLPFNTEGQGYGRQDARGRGHKGCGVAD